MREKINYPCPQVINWSFISRRHLVSPCWWGILNSPAHHQGYRIDCFPQTEGVNFHKWSTCVPRWLTWGELPAKLHLIKISMAQSGTVPPGWPPLLWLLPRCTGQAKGIGARSICYHWCHAELQHVLTQTWQHWQTALCFVPSLASSLHPTLTPLPTPPFACPLLTFLTNQTHHQEFTRRWNL